MSAKERNVGVEHLAAKLVFKKCTQKIMPLSLGLILGLNAAPASELDLGAEGRRLAFARDKGNCLACHVIAGGTQMGDIGPALADMRMRFPHRKRLRDQIWDAGKFNGQSLMPPFGRHEMLSASEINAIVEFLYTL